MGRWDHNLAGITQPRPPDDMLCALLYEQVRAMKCLELDMHLWNRDETVRNYEFLRTSVATAIELRTGVSVISLSACIRLLGLCLRIVQPLLRILRGRIHLAERGRGLLLRGLIPHRPKGGSLATVTKLLRHGMVAREGRVVGDL